MGPRVRGRVRGDDAAVGHTSAISPRMCASLAGRFARLKIRGRRECRALDAPAASHAK